MAMANYVEMIGITWESHSAGMHKDLSDSDIENIHGYAEQLTGDTQITREAVAHWLSLNSGDFQGVDDFYASIGALDIPWEDEASEGVFNSCMYADEDDDLDDEIPY